MRPINGERDQAGQLAYHLKRNDAPEFDKGQPGRIDLARFLVEKILVKDLRSRPVRIVELGCGAGDISGPYSFGHGIYHTARGQIALDGIEVIGYDVVPVAQEICARRWPQMRFVLGAVEDQEPIDCDILVMCEFLEHVADPLAISKAWMSRAGWAIIGHPLDDLDGIEPGHRWSYTVDDWNDWYWKNGFHIWERFTFPMGYWDAMVMGHGSRG